MNIFVGAGELRPSKHMKGEKHYEVTAIISERREAGAHSTGKPARHSCIEQ
jgi:hypothetical protein